MTVLGPVLPPSPRYPGHSVEEIEISRIVEKGHEFKISRDSTLSEADWSRVLKGEVILWAYGYLDYIDFQRIKRRTAFCRAFMPRPDKSYQNSSKKGDWVRQGPEAYTYDSPQCSSYEGNGVLPSRGGCPSRWPLGCCLSKLTSLKTSLPWRCCVSISL